jgi:hypothetical protein
VSALDDRRELIAAVASLPGKARAALSSNDPELFSYYGFGIVLNDAQLEAFRDLERWGPGAIHLLRWANRTGKTTGLTLIELMAIWKKWRYETERLEDWLDFTYKVLHAAPLNRLMGRAWESVDSFIRGSAWQQRNPLTNRQRTPFLAPFFEARSGKAPDGSESLWVQCANGGRIDYLSTHDGAGRMESETWWLLVWDEFVRHAPVGNIPLLFDQTFLPRSSDYMAPVILSGTVTEESDPIYAELEEIALESPKDWNVSSYERSVNFSQTQESIDRQMRVSIDKNVAGRSVSGKMGEGGRGALFPTFLMRNMLDHGLPEYVGEDAIKRLRAMGYEFISMFDHAATGDLNVVQTWALPWPIPTGDELLDNGGIIAVGLAEKRSGGHITPTLQAHFALEEAARFGSKVLIVDATGEGGALVTSGLRHELVGSGIGVVKADFGSRGRSKGTVMKEEGLQSLQRMMAWGLDYAADENGWVGDWPELNEGDTFGILSMPFAGNWRKLYRELSVLKRDDSHQRQDRAMTSVMGAWYLRRSLDIRQTGPQRFSIIPSRRRAARRDTVVVR